MTVGKSFKQPRLLAVLSGLALCVSLVSLTHAQPYASIIIDDLGDNYASAKEVTRIPAALTIAILPGTPYAKKTAELANKHGKDVMLHLPMQSISHQNQAPGMLQLHMSEQQFTTELRQSLQAIPYLKGVNNHMGSLLTRHPGHMKWLMRTLVTHDEDLFFVDSRTTKQSVALQVAREHDIPSVERDVFLDPDASERTIEQQFDRFVRLVKRQGYGLAIAHPYPQSLRMLKNRLASLEANGIRLIPVSEYIKLRRQQHVTCTGAACAGL